MTKQVRGLEMFHIRKQELNHMEFPCPSLSEQRAIIDGLGKIAASMEGLKGRQADTAAELRAMVPAVLDAAFHGKL
jgi:type I restriction enzyme S subunit